MNSGVVIPSIDVLSNEQSNISTQQEYTSRMIKEMKQFKKKHFYKMKEIQSLKSTFHKKSHSRKHNSKILFDLSTFHMTTLRDCIYNKTHSGTNFLDIPTSTRVKLFLERSNVLNDQSHNKDIFVIGNKNDIKSSYLDYEAIENYCKFNEITLSEISVKTNVGIPKLMQLLEKYFMHGEWYKTFVCSPSHSLKLF